MKLRANGETREILFEEPPECSVIVTGVPRNGEFGKWKHETLRAEYSSRYATTTTIPPRNDTPAPGPLEWTKVQTQVSPPDERSCGIIIEGARAADGSQLHVRDTRANHGRLRPGPAMTPTCLPGSCCARNSGNITHSVRPFTTLLAAIIDASTRPPLCTLFERGRIVGFVLGRGVARFQKTMLRSI